MSISDEAAVLIHAIEAELDLADGTRPTGASNGELELARWYVRRIQATSGLADPPADLLGPNLGRLVTDSWNYKATLSEAIVTFELDFQQAVRRARRDIRPR